MQFQSPLFSQAWHENRIGVLEHRGNQQMHLLQGLHGIVSIADVIPNQPCTHVQARQGGEAYAVIAVHDRACVSQ